jgi:drug/metabolite transporter (DMT)-like permease
LSRHGVLDALGAIALWGTLAVLGLKLRHVPPFLLVGVALLLGAACGARGIRLRGLGLRTLLLGVYGLFAYHLCLFVALRLAPPVEANLLNYLWPLLIVVLSPLIVRGVTLRPRHVAGAALGFGGAALLVTGGRLGFTGGALPGYLLAIAAAFIWSTYSLLTKRLGSFPTSAIATFCLVSGLLSIACHVAVEPRWAPAAADLPYLALVGVGPMGAAFYLWDRALKRGDPRVIGTLAYLTPLLSTLLIAAFGEGRLSPLSAVAMVLIVGGAAIGTWPQRAARRSATTASTV